jgi:hypothetical protein
MRVKRSFVFVLLAGSIFIGSAVSAQDRPFSRKAKQKAVVFLKQMSRAGHLSFDKSELARFNGGMGSFYRSQHVDRPV